MRCTSLLIAGITLVIQTIMQNNVVLLKVTPHPLGFLSQLSYRKGVNRLY